MKTLSFIPVGNSDNFNRNHRKENHFHKSYKAIRYNADRQELEEVVDLRTYATDSRNYACVWVHANGEWSSATDYAGGYGYHRESAAAVGAMQNAGLQGGNPGAGESAIREAIQAIFSHYYPDEKCHLVESYG